MTDSPSEAAGHMTKPDPLSKALMLLHMAAFHLVEDDRPAEQRERLAAAIWEELARQDYAVRPTDT